MAALPYPSFVFFRLYFPPWKARTPGVYTVTLQLTPSQAALDQKVTKAVILAPLTSHSWGVKLNTWNRESNRV